MREDNVRAQALYTSGHFVTGRAPAGTPAVQDSRHGRLVITVHEPPGD